MKRVIFLLLLTAAVVGVQAQDFDLYFANNISDVSNLRSIRNTSLLDWQRVTNGALATNKVQVEQVKSMFANTIWKETNLVPAYIRKLYCTSACFFRCLAPSVRMLP